MSMARYCPEQSISDLKRRFSDKLIERPAFMPDAIMYKSKKGLSTGALSFGNPFFLL